MSDPLPMDAGRGAPNTLRPHRMVPSGGWYVCTECGQSPWAPGVTAECPKFTDRRAAVSGADSGTPILNTRALHEIGARIDAIQQDMQAQGWEPEDDGDSEIVLQVVRRDGQAVIELVGDTPKATIIAPTFRALVRKLGFIMTDADAANLHPYECEGPGKCPHCRAVSPGGVPGLRAQVEALPVRTVAWSHNEFEDVLSRAAVLRILDGGSDAR